MDINHLNLTHKAGNQVKQGDYGTNLVFELRNYQNRLLKKYNGKEATVRVGNEFEKKVTVKGHEIEFTIDVLLEVGEYPIEVYIDNLVFPSDNSAYIVVRKGLKNYDLTYMFKTLRIDADALEDAINKLSTIDSDFIVNAINNSNLKIKADKIEGVSGSDTLKAGDSIFLEKIGNLVDSLKTILEKINGKESGNTEPKETDETRTEKETEKVDLSLYETIEQANKTKEELNLLISSLRSDVDRLNTLSNQPVQPDNTELNKVKETIESLNQAIKDSKESVLAEIKKSIEDVKNDVKTISEKVDTFDGRIGDVERRNTTYDDSELKRRVTDLEGRTVSAYDDTELKNEIADLKSKSGTGEGLKISDELYEKLGISDESEKTLEGFLDLLISNLGVIDGQINNISKRIIVNLLNEEMLYTPDGRGVYGEIISIQKNKIMTLSTNIPDNNIVKCYIRTVPFRTNPILEDGYAYLNHPFKIDSSKYSNIDNISIEITDSSYIDKIKSGEYWIMLNDGDKAKPYVPYVVMEEVIDTNSERITR